MSEQHTTYEIITEAEINDDADQEQRAAAIHKTGALLAAWRSRFDNDAISKSYPYSDGTITLHSAAPESLTVNYSVDEKLQAAYQFDGVSGELYGMTYAEDGTGTPVEVDEDTYEGVSLALFECDRLEFRAK